MIQDEIHINKRMLRDSLDQLIKREEKKWFKCVMSALSKSIGGYPCFWAYMISLPAVNIKGTHIEAVFSQNYYY